MKKINVNYNSIDAALTFMRASKEKIKYDSSWQDQLMKNESKGDAYETLLNIAVITKERGKNMDTLISNTIKYLEYAKEQLKEKDQQIASKIQKR